MIYKRKVYNELLAWKNSKVNNSALLIEGARRIGKSTIVDEFAKSEGKVEGKAENLNENIKTMHSNGFDAETIARALSLDINYVKEVLSK